MTEPSRFPGRRFLHSPGPTPLPDAVLHAMSVQPMDLGDPRVDANISAVEQGLRRLLHSERADVFLYACNGHGVWEAVVENLAAPGQAVLIAGTGHFSESWAIQTEALGRRVVRTPWREGWPIDADTIVPINSRPLVRESHVKVCTPRGSVVSKRAVNRIKKATQPLVRWRAILALTAFAQRRIRRLP